jgi:hypothetical protein
MQERVGADSPERRMAAVAALLLRRKPGHLHGAGELR